MSRKMWSSTPFSNIFCPLKSENNSTFLRVWVILRFFRVDLHQSAEEKAGSSRSVLVVHVSLFGLLEQGQELVHAQLHGSANSSEQITYAVPHVSIAVLFARGVLATRAVPEDKAAAREPECVAGAVASRSRSVMRRVPDSPADTISDALTSMTNDLSGSMYTSAARQFLHGCDIRLSSIPTAPTFIHGGGFLRSKGFQCCLCLLLRISSVPYSHPLHDPLVVLVAHA